MSTSLIFSVVSLTVIPSCGSILRESGERAGKGTQSLARSIRLEYGSSELEIGLIAYISIWLGSLLLTLLSNGNKSNKMNGGWRLCT